MNKFSYIIVFLLLFLSGQFSSCEYAPCMGFYDEPFFHLTNRDQDFKVYYSNNVEGDTILRGSTGNVKLPFDIHSTQMKYDFYAPEYKGSLILDYEVQPQECSETDEILLVFKKLDVNENSTFTDIYYRSYRDKQSIDSLHNLEEIFTAYDGIGSEFIFSF